MTQLRQRIARRSVGLRALLCLLVLGVLLSGVPTGVMHAHVDGDHGHAHELASLDDELPPVPGDGAGSTLHFHEAASVTQALPEPVAPAIASLPPMTWHGPLPATGPRLTLRSPPHRPPIA
jgi:hypothetical protein